jgi:hypothetical protein
LLSALSFENPSIRNSNPPEADKNPKMRYTGDTLWLRYDRQATAYELLKTSNMCFKEIAIIFTKI